MTLKRTLFLLFLVLATTSCASLIRPNYTQQLTELREGAYSLDDEHAYLNFKVEHLGLSYVVGRFNSLDATLDFNPDAISDLVLEGSIDVTSIDLNNDSLAKQLQGRGWLDTKQFPQATFKSTAVEGTEGNSFVVTGDFTLRGVTQSVELLASFKGGADNVLTGKYTLGFSATGSISRSQFGVDSFAALIGDEILLEIHAEFQRQN